MDRITLKSLTFRAPHGYYARERRDKNTFEVDITAWGDFRAAADRDDLNLAFDYQKAEQVVKDVMGGTSRKLIETLCSRIGTELFGQSPDIQKLNVVVRKLSPPLKTKTEHAEISMEWNR